MSALVNSGAHSLGCDLGYNKEPPKWSLYLTRTADKAQRKLDKQLRIRIKEALLRLMEDPENLGERLSQPLTSVMSYHINYQGKEFRIGYYLCLETEQIVILLIGPHENFYRKLKNLI